MTTTEYLVEVIMAVAITFLYMSFVAAAPWPTIFIGMFWGAATYRWITGLL